MSIQTEPPILDQFFAFLEGQARARSDLAEHAAVNPAGDEVCHDLDAMMALAVAAYEELGRFTQEVASGQGPIDPQVVREVREAHARYHDACQPVLRLLEGARTSGGELRHLDEFMHTVGEANLIAHRYDHVMQSEQQMQAARGRSLSEVRDGVRGRIRNVLDLAVQEVPELGSDCRQ